MFDSCSTLFDSCSTSIDVIESNKSEAKRQDPNKVEQLAFARTSRGDAKLSEKSYGIKIGSLVAENE